MNGVEEEGAAAFKGIPYVAPLRFSLAPVLTGRRRLGGAYRAYRLESSF